MERGSRQEARQMDVNDKQSIRIAIWATKNLAQQKRAAAEQQLSLDFKDDTEQ